MTMTDNVVTPATAALHAVGGSDGIVFERVESAVAELLGALGRDVTAPHLADTPRRVAESFIELLTPGDFSLTTFPDEGESDGLVLVTDIPFHSLCAHHLLPFRGVAHIGYLPGGRIVGLSKLARALDYFARDLQVQERLTTQVADWLDDRLAPRGVGVVLEAEHLCMSLRGVRASGARTVTSALRGRLRDEPEVRREFFDRIGSTGAGASRREA